MLMKIKKSNQTKRLDEAIAALVHIVENCTCGVERVYDDRYCNCGASFVASNTLAVIQALEEEQNGDHPVN